jgi:uncharacterized protein (DUF1330 family)
MQQLTRFSRTCVIIGLILASSLLLGRDASLAQQDNKPAFVIIERTATTGPESIQADYAKLAREILPRYGGHYLARSQNNSLLEGDASVPCCMAILEFSSLDAVHRWYDSPENQSAAKIRQSGAKFRIIAIEGLPG